MKRTPLRRKTPLNRAKAFAPVAAKPKRKAPRKRPPMKRCDDLARAICKARGRCEGRPGHVCAGALQWCHVIGRGDHWVRHDEDNALLMCQREHVYFTHRHTEWVEFVGVERYMELHRRAFAGLRQKIDWRAREAALTSRARELGVAL